MRRFLVRVQVEELAASSGAPFGLGPPKVGKRHGLRGRHGRAMKTPALVTLVALSALLVGVGATSAVFQSAVVRPLAAEVDAQNEVITACRATADALDELQLSAHEAYLSAGEGISAFFDGGLWAGDTDALFTTLNDQKEVLDDAQSAYDFADPDIDRCSS